MTRRFLISLAILSALFLLSVARLFCQPVNLVGDATATDSTIQLNWPLPQQAGAAWLSRKVSLRDPFTLRWSFVISDTGGEADPSGKSGGDGLAFVIQAMGPGAIGGQGYALGYGRIPNDNPGILASLAVEFDTWDDADLLYWPGFVDFPADHMAIHTMGRGWNCSNGDGTIGALRTVAQIPDIDDGREHAVTVTYAPGVLSVALDTLGTVLRWYGRLDTLLGADSAYVGWTAATMSAWETHTITSAKWGDCVGDTVTVHDTTFIRKVDSVITRDTTFIRDTVIRHDTSIVVEHRVDSVPYPVAVHDTSYINLFTVVHDTLETRDTLTLCYVRDTCTGVTLPDSVCGASNRGMLLNQPTLRIIALFPNPTDNYATLRYETADEGLAVITVYDATGRAVRVYYDAEGPGVKAWSFEVGGWPSGRYEVVLRSGGGEERAGLEVVK